jgi:iron complex transport system substrate-binding protein
VLAAVIVLFTALPGSAAERIISLAPHLTELLYAAGAGERVVGAVDYSDYPPAARHIPRIGTADRIDYETVLALAPDLVVAWRSGSPRSQVERLAALGLPIYWSDAARLEEIPDELEKLGRHVGTAAPAARAAGAYRDGLRRLRAQYRDARPVRVFYEIWDRPLMTINGGHLISDVLRLCGAENIFADLPDLTPNISTEAVLVADPEVIVVGAFAADREAWLDRWRARGQLAAVRAGRLVSTDPDLLHRPTTRVLEGARQLCAALDAARGG